MELFPAVWNGTLREHYLLLFSVAGSIALVAGFVGAWFGARVASRRMIDELRETLPSGRQQELASEQLTQLSQAMDVMAIEVERLSEGQRFTAKLLADAGALPRSVIRPHGAVTPH
jgi:hypothetical protein